MSNDKEAVIKKFPNWTDVMFDILIKSNKRYTELIFEQIRMVLFRDLPSRSNCMFFCEEKSVEDWYNWYKSMILRTGAEKLFIYKFELSGKIHKADQKWLNQDILAHANYIEAAKKYWQGEPVDINAPLFEILFSGEVKRIKKFEHIDDFKKSC